MMNLVTCFQRIIDRIVYDENLSGPFVHFELGVNKGAFDKSKYFFQRSKGFVLSEGGTLVAKQVKLLEYKEFRKLIKSDW